MVRHVNEVVAYIIEEGKKRNLTFNEKNLRYALSEDGEPYPNQETVASMMDGNGPKHLQTLHENVYLHILEAQGKV